MKKVALILIWLVCLAILIVSATCLVYYGVLPLDAKQFPGYYGDLCIPSVGINVPCVLVDGEAEGSKYLQFIVHQKNCAAMFWMSNGVIINGEELGAWCIGDHNYQGFDVLAQCEIGDEATFTNVNGNVEKYTVTKVFTGHNTKGDLVDENMESVVEYNLGGIILYTCLDSWENVQIVFLQPIES